MLMLSVPLLPESVNSSGSSIAVAGRLLPNGRYCAECEGDDLPPEGWQGLRVQPSTDTDMESASISRLPLLMIVLLLMKSARI